MIKKIIALAVALALMTGVALAAAWEVDQANESNFLDLLYALMYAYETPSSGDAEAIEAAVAAIEAVNAPDGAIARSIADHWKKVYLDPSYALHMYDGGKSAGGLLNTAIPDSPTHAFVVLGYELKDGEMTPELMGRCDAAGAAASAFPHALLVCSGGATGKNNPKNHTEAGLMKAYLAENWAVDPERIHIDERAMTTLENAVNTLDILREQGVQTITIITSGYHQRWGQVLYNAMSAIFQQTYGYSVQILENYCFDIEPSDKRYLQGDRIALNQLAKMLDLPESR